MSIYSLVESFIICLFSSAGLNWIEFFLKYEMSWLLIWYVNKQNFGLLNGKKNIQFLFKQNPISILKQQKKKWNFKWKFKAAAVETKVFGVDIFPLISSVKNYFFFSYRLVYVYINIFIIVSCYGTTALATGRTHWTRERGVYGRKTTPKKREKNPHELI